MPKPIRLAMLAIVPGLAAAAFTTDLAGLRAEFESPLQFSVNQQQRHRSGAQIYSREPVRIGRSGGFFSNLFEFDFQEEAPRPRVASPDLQRAVCKRQCDGAQLVLGFLPSRSEQRDAEAMCAAAGGAAKTELVLEKFVPGAGFEVSEPIQTASAAPLLEGRAALDSNARTAAAVSEPCPAGASRNSFMTVPILHDVTLRSGDVVATRDGFKVFVGRGRPPFKERDFVALDSRKRVAADLRKLKVDR